MKSFQLLEHKKNDFACLILRLNNTVFSRSIRESLLQICESYLSRPLKGFRKGTVPLDLIELRHREEVFNYEKEKYIESIMLEALETDELKNCGFSKKIEVFLSSSVDFLIYQVVIFNDEKKIDESVDAIFENYFKNNKESETNQIMLEEQETTEQETNKQEPKQDSEKHIEENTKTEENQENKKKQTNKTGSKKKLLKEE